MTLTTNLTATVSGKMSRLVDESIQDVIDTLRAVHGDMIDGFVIHVKGFAGAHNFFVFPTVGGVTSDAYNASADTTAYSDITDMVAVLDKYFLAHADDSRHDLDGSVFWFAEDK